MSPDVGLRLFLALGNLAIGVAAVALVGVMIAGAVIVGVLLSHSQQAARHG